MWDGLKKYLKIHHLLSEKRKQRFWSEKGSRGFGNLQNLWVKRQEHTY
jgi:hypothetical protein